MLRPFRFSFFIGCSLVVLVSTSVFSSESKTDAIDYTNYQSVLKTYVSSEGRVDYAGLKKNAEQLDASLSSIGSLEPATYESWPEADRIAFLINAYNAYTLKAIINHYPIQSTFLGRLRFPANSIRQISGVWDKLQWNLMGEMVTIDGIEHGTLRKDFNEPRIHFAVNCASMGCPVLLNQPYVGERLDKQLDAQVTRFLKRPLDFHHDANSGAVKLSMILSWYAGDFVQFADKFNHFDYLGREQRGVMNFLYPYLSESQQTAMKEKRISISYLDYDWSLNEQ